MKKTILSILVIGCLFLGGCLETTEEITLNDDGSGTLSTTSDMSALIGMAKTMGGGAEMEKFADIDTSVSLENGADNIPNLSPEDRMLVKTGTMKSKRNFKEEKLYMKLIFPFNSPSQIENLNKLTNKVLAKGATDLNADMMKDAPAGAADQMGETSSLDDYYNLEFSNGELTRKVNKSKYAGAESDKVLQGMKQLAGMGLAMKVNYIYNLPRPATKAEGKNVKLSTDKKQVKISIDLDDFFEDASALEFKIKY